MKSSFSERSLDCLPKTFACKDGRRIELRRLPPEAGEPLVDMYLAFQPRNSFQGLPPIKDAVCVKWVHEMLATAVNIVAVDRPAGLVGHVGLFPISREKCEMLVVVCPGYQNLGIGTELVRGCVEAAGELGFERIWLPVNATNVRARHVYRKCGFANVSEQPGREVNMVCHVPERRPAPVAPATIARPIVPPLHVPVAMGMAHA